MSAKAAGGPKWLYLLLSVVIATVFWIYIRNTQDIELTTTVRNIPVSLYGEQILEDQGMTIASISDQSVSIDVTASQDAIHRLLSGSTTATLNVSRCSSPDEYELSYELNYPGSVSASEIRVNDRYPSRITVLVEKLNAQTFTIEPRFQGSVAPGYQAGTWSLSQESVVVSGPLEQLNRIAKVEAVVMGENLSERFSGDVPLTLLDQAGEVLESGDVKLSIESVYVTMPVEVVKDIPLTVKLVSGGGASEENCEPVFSPSDHITVSGAEEDLSGLEEISLGSIDLSKVVGTGSFTFPITLDPSLNNVSGFSEVTVTLTINDLDTRTLDVGNIQLINVPSGRTAQATTQFCRVVLRGNGEILEQIDESQILIVADLANVTALGACTVPVKIYLNAPEEVGVIGTYTIVVNIA